MNEFQSKMANLLESKSALAPCPRCANEGFSMNDKPFNLESGGDGGWGVGEYMPCVLLACKKCGYVFMYVIAILEEDL